MPLLLFSLVIAFMAGTPPAGHPDPPTTLVFPTFLHTMGIRKATKFHLMIYTRNRVKVRDPEGIAVARLNSWEDSGTSKDDDEVTGYGVNSGANMVVYNTSMTSLGFYGLTERGGKRLNRPTGIAANALGDVYVADTGNHRVVRLFNPKAELRYVAALGKRGKQIGEFEAPRGVALDPAGNLYVGDTGNHRIQMFDPQNQYLGGFGTPGTAAGELWFPRAITVTTKAERWSHFKDEFVVIADRQGSRLQKFSLEGQFLCGAAVADFFGQDGEINYIALDYYSNIWATDIRNHCVHKFDRNLNYLTSFGKRGTGDREFVEPRGIAVYRRFGQVFIADKESAQYYWIGTDIRDFEVKLMAAEIEVSFFLTEPSYVTLQIEKKGEDVILKPVSKAKYYTGAQTLKLDPAWQLQGHRNDRTPPQSALDKLSGKYLLTLTVEPTYSSAKYFSKAVETSLSIP